MDLGKNISDSNIKTLLDKIENDQKDYEKRKFLLERSLAENIINLFDDEDYIKVLLEEFEKYPHYSTLCLATCFLCKKAIEEFESLNEEYDNQYTLIEELCIGSTNPNDYYTNFFYERPFLNYVENELIDRDFIKGYVMEKFIEGEEFFLEIPLNKENSRPYYMFEEEGNKIYLKKSFIPLIKRYYDFIMEYKKEINKHLNKIEVY